MISKHLYRTGIQNEIPAQDTSQRKAVFTLKKAERHLILLEEKHSQVLSLRDDTRAHTHTHIMTALRSKKCTICTL